MSRVASRTPSARPRPRHTHPALASPSFSHSLHPVLYALTVPAAQYALPFLLPGGAPRVPHQAVAAATHFLRMVSWESYEFLICLLSEAGVSWIPSILFPFSVIRLRAARLDGARITPASLAMPRRAQPPPASPPLALQMGIK